MRSETPGIAQSPRPSRRSPPQRDRYPCPEPRGSRRANASRDDDGHRDDAPALAPLHAGAVSPQIRPVAPIAVDRPAQETPPPCHRSACTARSPLLAIPSCPSPSPGRTGSHRARRQPGHVGLLHHRRGRRTAALAQLGDARLHRPGTDLPQPVAIAVALRQPLRALLIPAGSSEPSTSSSISRYRMEIGTRAQAHPRRACSGSRQRLVKSWYRAVRARGRWRVTSSTVCCVAGLRTSARAPVLQAHHAVDHHVYDCVEHFLTRRHKCATRVRGNFPRIRALRRTPTTTRAAWTAAVCLTIKPVGERNNSCGVHMWRPHLPGIPRHWCLPAPRTRV